jgi:hypothetical protein
MTLIVYYFAFMVVGDMAATGTSAGFSLSIRAEGASSPGTVYGRL